MQVSLKKAADLERACDEELKRMSFDPTLRVSTYTEGVPDVDAQRAKLRDRIKLMMDLTAARFALRAEIGAVNASVGVTLKITERKRIETQINKLAEILRGFATHLGVKTPEEALAERRFVMENSGERSYREAHILMTLATDDLIDEVTMQINSLRRYKQDVIDDLSRLNLSNSITITSTVQDTLRRANIIV